MIDLFEFIDPPSILHIKVTPKAKAEKIKKAIQPDGSVLYKIYVTALPEDGKANEAVINLIAKSLGVAKSRLTIIRGHTAREKVIEVKKTVYGTTS